ncbi:MAG: hypothetical protein ACRC5A_03315 [Enterobacteriaceae bacterium]
MSTVKPLGGVKRGGSSGNRISGAESVTAAQKAAFHQHLHKDEEQDSNGEDEESKEETEANSSDKKKTVPPVGRLA